MKKISRNLKMIQKFESFSLDGVIWIVKAVLRNFLKKLRKTLTVLLFLLIGWNQFGKVFTYGVHRKF